MGVEGIKTVNYGAAQKPQPQPSEGRRKLVFTSDAEIGKALETGTVTVDGVSVTLSDEARQALADARERLAEARETEALRYMMEYSSYAAKRQSEMTEDINEDMAKALETARRIARGDIVPAIDEQKLMEYDSELYQMAKNAAMLHAMEERRKDKSLYGDEEERDYTDPEAETEPQREFGVEVDLGALEEISLPEGE